MDGQRQLLGIAEIAWAESKLPAVSEALRPQSFEHRGQKADLVVQQIPYPTDWLAGSASHEKARKKTCQRQRMGASEAIGHLTKKTVRRR